jgi:hypothetical protein
MIAFVQIFRERRMQSGMVYKKGSFSLHCSKFSCTGYETIKRFECPLFIRLRVRFKNITNCGRIVPMKKKLSLNEF